MIKSSFVSRIQLLLLALTISFVSCEKEKEPEFEPQYLVEHTEIANLSRNTIISMLSQGDFLPTEASIFIKYGVKAIRITYQTLSYDLQPTLASGVLLIPENPNPMPMLSFQHGTITEESSAPSNFQSGYSDIATIFASTGYIISVPDYLGYGSSKHIDHPYEHRASLATACRDMLRASYEYFKVIKQENLLNEKLFLTGYSEGGFATMSMFKLLQENHADEFNITAVTVGAGAYNKTAFADWIIGSNEDLFHINSFVWVLDVYNTIYSQLNRPYSYYFNEPWASIIANQGVFAPIEQNPQLLLTASFIDNYSGGYDTELISVFAENNCYDWKPLSPLQLYHGTDDIYVPYFNSSTAYDAMVYQGSTEVELITVQGGDHVTTLADYSIGTFMFFQSFLAN